MRKKNTSKKKRCPIFRVNLKTIKMVSVGTMSFQEVILDVLEKAKSKQCYFVWENCPIVVDRNATVESLEQQFQRRTQRKKAFENGQKLAAEFVEKVNQRAEEWQEVHWRKSYGY